MSTFFIAATAHIKEWKEADKNSFIRNFTKDEYVSLCNIKDKRDAQEALFNINSFTIWQAKHTAHSYLHCAKQNDSYSETLLSEFNKYWDDREEEVIAALSSGATAYCLKDIDPTKLADVVRDVADGVCWIDPEVAHFALNSLPKNENIGILTNKSGSEGRVPLTEREFEVLKHLASGKSNTEIAKELIVSVHTAKAHVCSILQKMCVNDRVQAAVKAVKEGLV